MTVSRTCPDDCPEIWVGYTNRRGKKRPYRLCVQTHYLYETHAENEARKTHEAPLLLCRRNR